MYKYKKSYSKNQELQIATEFQRLKDIYYLDHAGATLYSEKQMSNILSDFSNNLYGNPHSNGTFSKITHDSIDQVRYQILSHFNTNTDEYNVIFTNGATGALKLISESFDYDNGYFVYLQDNHTSVLGMRNNAPNVNVLKHNEAFNVFSNDVTSILDRNPKNSLFVYPAQCNFSGTKYPLQWIKKTQEGVLSQLYNSNKWYCLLDAAAYVSTNFLDLSKYKPDFVCVSFYKIFGYPTGLGALLVKNESKHILIKKYYGGGTVFMALSTENVAIPRTALHERFEDGTISFLDILAIKHGFNTLKRLNLKMDLISEHTFSLARYVYYQLIKLHHSNNEPVVVLYHDTTFEDRTSQGGIINFNLRRSNGEYIGYAEVLHIANLFGIQLRTGCFCNPGSCQRHLNLTANDVIKQYEKGHVCGDQNDLINGVPTGSVRISFGYMSTKKDADEFLKMIEECFVEKPCVRKIPENFEILRENYLRKFSLFSNSSLTTEIGINDHKNEVKRIDNSFSAPKKIEIDRSFKNIRTINGSLENMYIYPIKSCGAFEIDSSWRLVPTGFQYDREWMIVDSSGVCLTQKRNTNLCRIKPSINLKENELELRYENMQKTSIPLLVGESRALRAFPCRSKVCGDPVVGWDCGQEVSDWISSALNERDLRLLRQCSNDTYIRKKTVQGESIKLSLTNQGQFLLLNRSSIERLQKYLVEDSLVETINDLIGRFRPNLVVNFEEPFIENDLLELKIKELTLKASGKCTRCQVICIDQNTGEKSADLLRILSKEFHGKICFGLYLRQAETNENPQISANTKVTANIVI